MLLEVATGVGEGAGDEGVEVAYWLSLLSDVEDTIGDTSGGKDGDGGKAVAEEVKGVGESGEMDRGVGKEDDKAASR